jgi:hypothetical protein
MRNNQSTLVLSWSMKAPNPSGTSKSTSLLPSPSEEFMRSKRSMQPLHQVILSTLGFVTLHVQDEGNFKLKKHVALTTTLTKELDSTTEEVKFWQGKYEEAMKTIQKMKHCYPQD